MKAIIVEDEALSAVHLKTMLFKTAPEIEVVNILDSVKSSVQYLLEKPPIDLIFLDIHLADGLSFEIFQQVEVMQPVIFTTAYDEYAIKAFKVNSIDYLLKPIGLGDLKNAINKLDTIQLDFEGKKIEDEEGDDPKTHRHNGVDRRREYASRDDSGSGRN